MGIDTLLVAVGTDDGVDTETLADAIVPLAESTGADIYLAHALSRDEAETAADRLDVDVSSPGSDEAVGEPPNSTGQSFYQQLWPGMSSETDADSLNEGAQSAVGQFAAVSDLETALSDAGVGADVVGSVGDPAPEVVRLADEHDADMIVVGRRDRSGASQALFGSTSEEIVERSPVPVVVASE